MNKDERNHYGKLSQLGCIVCIKLGFGYTAPHIHHIRHGAGMGQKTHYSKAIPLCPNHHQHGGYGVAIHAGQKQFESLYGSEESLLELVTHLMKDIS
jgi:hypothetical protein